MASSFAAGAGADMLQEILKQKFIEQLSRAKLAEEVRQNNLMHQVQQGQLGQGQQRIDLSREQMGQQAHQFDVTSGQRGEQIAMQRELQPVRIKQITAQTADLERKPQAEEAARTFTSGENEKNRQNAVRVAGIRASTTSASEPLVQVRGPDGGTVYMPRSQAAGMQAPEKTPPRMQAGPAQLIAGADASLHQLDKLEQMLPAVQGSIGPLAGRAADLQQKIPGLPVNQQMASFLAETATLKNATVKAITGAQMSEPEAKRIMAQIPLETDKPEVWIQKAKATRDNLAFMRNKMQQLYGAENQQGPAPTDSATKALELLKKYGG